MDTFVGQGVGSDRNNYTLHELPHPSHLLQSPEVVHPKQGRFVFPLCSLVHARHQNLGLKWPLAKRLCQLQNRGNGKRQHKRGLSETSKKYNQMLHVVCTISSVVATGDTSARAGPLRNAYAS